MSNHRWDADMESTVHLALDDLAYSDNPVTPLDPEETDLIDLTAVVLDAITERYDLTPRTDGAPVGAPSTERRGGCA